MHMRYAIADVDPKVLGKLEIDQDWMMREFNQKFIPRQVYDTIKRRSKDFTEEDPLLLEASELLKKMIDQDGKPLPQATAPTKKEEEPAVDPAVMIQIAAAARKRQIEILKLKRKRAKQKAQ